MEQVNKILKEGSYKAIETLALKTNKKVMNIEVIPQYIKGKPELKALSIRDISEQKKTEQALKDNKRKFEAIFNQTFSFIGLLTREGLLLEANTTSLDFIGMKAETVIGRYAWETPWWSHSEEQAMLVREGIQKASKGEFIRFETKHIDYQGNEEHIDFSLKPVFNEFGQVELIIPEGRIITQQKKAEVELWKAQNLLTEAIEQSPSGIIIADAPDGHIRIANTSAKQLFGDIEYLYPPRNKDGSSPMWKLLNQANKTSAIEALPMHRVLKTGTLISNEEWVLYSDQQKAQWLLINAAPIYNETGDISSGILVINNITQSKEMEEELRKSEEKYRQLIEVLPDAVTLVQDDSIVFCNHVLAEMIGAKSSNELEGKKFIDFIVPEQREKVIDGKNNLIQGGSIHPYLETTLRKTDNSTLPVDIIATTLVHNNKPTIMACIRDISERKNTEQKILNAVIKTEERERSHFAEEIHDGLGPIFSTIKLYAQSAIDESDPIEKTALLTRIQTTISEAIVSLREISNNISPHVLRNFGLPTALKTFIDKVGPVSKINFIVNNSITYRLSETIETIIYRVLIELINNTLKHANASEVRIDLKIMNDMLNVAYHDNGQVSNLKKVFNNKKGMGLFNIQNRIHSLNGQVEFNNKAGKGFTAQISINLSMQRFYD